jgi:hypothetical protein
MIELRPDRRERALATATLACPSCDAPVVPPWTMLVTEPLACPFCGHDGLVRDFLTLGAPTRPARVVLRVARPEQQRVARPQKQRF